MKATIVYYSHKGRTARYARDMAMYLWSKGVSVSLCSVSDLDRERLRHTDVLLLGCWTCGWFVVRQHPHRRWTELARTLQGMFTADRLLLFTTYKIMTGTMFGKMKRALGLAKGADVACLKSRTAMLTDEDRQTLNRLIGNYKH